MSGEIPNLRGGHTATALAILVPIVSLAAMFGGIIWQAARYPTRDEFRAATNDLASVKQDTAIQKYRLDGTEARLGEIKVTTDKILEELRSGGKRR